MKQQILIKILILTLFAGTLFAYYSVLKEFMEFYGMYKNIFRIKDCAIPNPITTPCFYGAFAFLVSLIYSIKIRKMNFDKMKKHTLYLILLLVASNIFAGVNNTIIFYKYFTPSDNIGCSGRSIDNPFTTPCFVGGTIFFIALLVAFLIFEQLKKKNKE